MCGIFGIVDCQHPIQSPPAHRALDLLAHRGPDGAGVWQRGWDHVLHRAVDEPWRRQAPLTPQSDADRNAVDPAVAPFVWFGHRRLSILDLTSASDQPMYDPRGPWCLIYNGEIYNYVELRDELQSLGHRFLTAGDTEVVLAAYREWGSDCLAKFNGMFAFALWDERRQSLFAARDRFGEKPFHYVWMPEHGFFAFASEIKALVALPQVGCALDDDALYQYIAFKQLAAAENTLYRHVKRLPHGHFLTFQAKGNGVNGSPLQVKQYYDIDLSNRTHLSLTQAAARFAELFSDGVRLRLRSDVPVGTSLSGGLDSSAVVCGIDRLGASGGQKTFSARMEDPRLDEGRHIAQVLEQTQIAGYDVWPKAALFVELFDNLCYHQEEPIASTSQFAQHLVMRLAKSHGVTVLLDGQGADEYLGGYRPYFLVRYGDLADHWRLPALLREWKGFRARHERNFPLPTRSLLGRMFRAVVGRKPNAPAPSPALAGPWWSEAWYREHAQTPLPMPTSGKVERDALTNRLYADTFHGHLQELLRYGDRNSMAYALEVRQPFLDHRLVELAFSLGPEQKIRNGETKVLLREAARGLIPETIRTRQDKLGYEAPMGRWFQGELRDWTLSRLDAMRGVFGDRLRDDAVETFRRSVASPAEMRDAGAAGETLAWQLIPMLTLAGGVEQLRLRTSGIASEPCILPESA